MARRDVFEVVDGDVRIRIEGLRDTLRALSKAGADAEDMKDLMHAMGSIVVSAARPRTPVRSGWLASTVRAGRGKTKAVVRMGTRARPYAGVVHYGWPARNIRAQPSLVDAYQATRGQVLRRFDDGLTELLQKNNLK
jgi:hypothetical protein